MKINLSVQNEVILTNKQQKYLEKRLQKLDRFIKNRSEALVVDIKLSDETGSNKGGVDKQVSITIQIPGEQAPLHIIDTEDKVMRAFNVAISKVERQMRDSHRRLVKASHKGGRFDKVFGIIGKGFGHFRRKK